MSSLEILGTIVSVIAMYCGMRQLRKAVAEINEVCERED